MIIGVLTIELLVPGSNSLKDKRQVVKSLLANIKNKFNVSAAEIDNLDSHRRAGLAFACVSNERGMANRMLDKIIDYIQTNPLCEIGESDIEFL